MTSDSFLYATLNRQNSFLVPALISLNNISFANQVKIDTGCAQSTIPFRRLASVSHEKSLQYKQSDLDFGLPYVRSYGVSDTDEIRKKDAKLIKAGRYMECTSLKFKHANTHLILNGYTINTDIYVNYDRTGSILIGMDILKQFQSVTDISQITGQYTFIGCLISQSDKSEFYTALYEHFGIKYS